MPLCPEMSFGAAPILVTGASSGIGLAIALRLNALGATVLASARNPEKLAVARKLARFPEKFRVERKDLLEQIEGLDKWVDALASRYGKLGGLVCAAGKTDTLPLSQYDYDDARKMFDLLTHAPIMLAKGATRSKNRVADGFAIVFIAAAASISPNKGQMVYAAAKAALVRAAHCMAKELAPRGVRVNCVSPGLVKTPMFDETVDLLGEDFVEKEEKLYPLGLGEPQDVANLTVFLLSQAARWITAQNIVIDGGRLA